MSKKIDLTGQRFGRLVVIKRLEERTKQGGLIWLCECDCGNTTNVPSYKLTRKPSTEIGGTSGPTKSCGCLKETYKEEDTFENTRIATLTMKVRKDNESGHKGVSYIKKTKKWRALITVKRERIYLGSFANKQDAINARKKAEEKYFKPILEKYNKE